MRLRQSMILGPRGRLGRWHRILKRSVTQLRAPPAAFGPGVARLASGLGVCGRRPWRRVLRCSSPERWVRPRPRGLKMLLERKKPQLSPVVL